LKKSYDDIVQELADLDVKYLNLHRAWRRERADRIRFEKIIHNIANIDTLFINPDGTERDWDDKEALREIENLVRPIWNEHCEKSWEKHRQKAKESQ
jgi:hypothetical protein